MVNIGEAEGTGTARRREIEDSCMGGKYGEFKRSGTARGRGIEDRF